MALQKEINLINEKIKSLEILITNERKAELINQESLEDNAKAVELELIAEESAAALFAELNGLIQGQSFAHANYFESHSINMHKTMEEVIDDFASGLIQIENADNQGLVHAEHKRFPQANMVEAQASSSQGGGLVARNDLLDLAHPAKKERDEFVVANNDDLSDDLGDDFSSPGLDR